MNQGGIVTVYQSVYATPGAQHQGGIVTVYQSAQAHKSAHKPAPKPTQQAAPVVTVTEGPAPTPAPALGQTDFNSVAQVAAQVAAAVVSQQFAGPAAAAATAKPKTDKNDPNGEYWRGVYNERIETLVDSGLTIPQHVKITWKQKSYRDKAEQLYELLVFGGLESIGDDDDDDKKQRDGEVDVEES